MGSKVFSVTDNIICIRRASYFTCSYVVTHPSGLVLVDAGMASGGDDVRLGLEYLNASPSDISAILLTHWHNDHAAGAKASHEWSGAPVYYHEGDADYFTGKTGATGFRAWVSELIPEMGPLVLAKGLLGEATPRPVEAQCLARENDTILNDFVVLETPGHTPGHLSFYYQPEKTLFAGDALAVIDDRIRFMARPVTPELEMARRSMERCLQLQPEVICPGHRHPLAHNVPEESERMLQYLQNGGHWPLLG